MEAIHAGWDVITQASLYSLPWRGFADLLINVPQRSKLGDYSYEVADTKLSSATKSSAVLQLCLYTDLLTSIQGEQPQFMSVVKPKDRRQSDRQQQEGHEPIAQFSVDRLRVDDYMAYYRMAKKDFEASIQASSMATQPEPCEHCTVCNWWPKCNQEWQDQDHLGFVAGISKSQRIELGEQGIFTLTALAESEKPLQSHPKRGAVESYAKVRHQAKVQLRGSRSGRPEYDFVKEEKDRGFQLLPEPTRIGSPR